MISTEFDRQADAAVEALIETLGDQLRLIPPKELMKTAYMQGAAAYSDSQVMRKIAAAKVEHLAPREQNCDGN